MHKSPFHDLLPFYYQPFEQKMHLFAAAFSKLSARLYESELYKKKHVHNMRLETILNKRMGACTLIKRFIPSALLKLTYC
ncbi:hypothetical protein A7975_16140 [Bacillus sp. FJAT-26390]|nr:hypothetical protein A7975_16140 [Bacillus sp. FJAT-26390]